MAISVIGDPLISNFGNKAVAVPIIKLTPFHGTGNSASSGRMSSIIHPDAESAKGDLWVFGYGSLMWRPGFDHVEKVQARLVGEHRALCVYSFVHRGTPEKPGLVLGLDRGGACRGIAYRVDRVARPKTITYLRAREQVTMVYREAWRDVLIEGEPERRVRALVYVVDRGHAQYAGRLDLDKQLHFVR